MNRNQRIVILVGVVIVVATFLYPPWVMYVPMGEGKVSHGYSFILKPLTRNSVVDIHHLIFQSLLIAGAVGAMVLFFKEKD